MTYTFRPRGVCSQEMRVEVDDAGIIQKMEVLGGCSGNLQGISALVVGMPGEAIHQLPKRFRLCIVWVEHGDARFRVRSVSQSQL